MKQESELPQEDGHSGLISGLIGFVTKILLLIAVTGAVIAAIITTLVLASFDTQYAPRYSEKAFKSIKIGVTEETVLSRLGPPLSAENSKQFIQWIYSAENEGTFSQDGIASGTYTTIEFDPHGRVTSVFGQRAKSPNSVSYGDAQNHLGLSHQEIEDLKGRSQDTVRRRFGNPTAVYEYKASRVLVYSRSPSSSNYRLRKLGLDDQGRVVHIWNCIYWD